ncbi:MAG TPA: carboxymuconolactone decarboxylase family protein [Streptosporangiaceae bacterium]|nr:carboxymuconolactone decarboxylase family protein [Streptosporangiaceae bacterium]
MSSALMRRALRGAQNQVRYVRPVRPRDAHGQVAATYLQVERDFGMLAPPVSLHSPAPGPLTACWVMLRETLLASGHAGRAAKETVAAVVSDTNTCPYCVAVHGATVRHLDGVASTARAPGDPPPGIGSWARACTARASATSTPDPVPAGQRQELIGVVVTFQYLNRMVNVFLPEDPVPAQAPAAVRGTAMRVLGRFMGSAASQHVRPGEALALLPDAPLPADLAWATGHATVAGAMARAAAAIDATGRGFVPATAREAVTAELARWDGRPRGPGRAWVHDAVSGLRSADRPAARLALLTALASHQVSQSDVTAFQVSQPGDEPLVSLTSWAAMAAARQVGSWVLPTPASATASLPTQPQ